MHEKVSASHHRQRAARSGCSCHGEALRERKKQEGRDRVRTKGSAEAAATERKGVQEPHSPAAAAGCLLLHPELAGGAC